jgi:hypothetical protein
MPCCHPDPNYPSDPHKSFVVIGTCTNEKCPDRGNTRSKVIRHCSDEPLYCMTCMKRMTNQ